MNRAALAARFFVVVALLPAIGAASFAAYMYRNQPPIPPGTFRQGGPSAPQVLGKLSKHGLLLGTYAPTSIPKHPRGKIPTGTDVKGLREFNSEVGSPATLTVQYTLWGEHFPAR